MFKPIRAGCLLFFSFLNPYFSSLEDGILVLSVANTADDPVSNITLTCKGDCSQQSAVQGKIRLKLPPETRPGESVTLQVVKHSGCVDWVLISPWDGRAVVPAFDNKADNFVSVVVARKGDKDMLRSGKAVESVAVRVINAVTPKVDRQISVEERRLVLKQQADALGLTIEEVDQAILDLGRKAKDPYSQEVAALYEKNFATATKLMTQSYEMRKEAVQKANTEYIDAADQLGNSLYQQENYAEAATKFEEVIQLKKEDAVVFLKLGISWYRAGQSSKNKTQLEKAIINYNKAIDLNLDDAAAYYNRGVAYQEKEEFDRAIADYSKAIDLKPDFAAIYYNRGIAYREKKDLDRAVADFIKALDINPNNESAYLLASELYHEMLFKFPEAFSLNQRWLARHPKDISTQTDFAERRLTTGRFEECERRINELLAKPEVTASSKSALRAIEIADLLALNKADKIPARIEALIADVLRQPVEFRVTWSFQGTRHFINQNEKFSSYRDWLGRLFDALAGKDRETILKELQAVRKSFK
jgi:tetratricopeptide (TPR) repeat protein